MNGGLDLKMLAAAAEMAKALEAPERLLEVARHHKAIIGALNNSHVNGEQDALCVFEALAHTIAQLIGGMEPKERDGILRYIAARSEVLGQQYKTADKIAAHQIQ